SSRPVAAFLDPVGSQPCRSAPPLPGPQPRALSPRASIEHALSQIAGAQFAAFPDGPCAPTALTFTAFATARLRPRFGANPAKRESLQTLSRPLRCVSEAE